MSLRSPNSLPKDDIIIEDPLLEPFFITSTPLAGYTVYERVEKKSNKKNYIRLVSYPSKFTNALRRIAKELLDSGDKKKYTSVTEYLRKWEEINKRMESLVDLEENFE